MITSHNSAHISSLPVQTGLWSEPPEQASGDRCTPSHTLVPSEPIGGCLAMTMLTLADTTL